MLGMPCWQTRRIHGSIISMEFGEPRLEITEPRVRPLHIAGAPDRAPRRAAYVYGDWTLTLTDCEWSILLEGALLAHSESSDTTINRALHVLNGQAFESIQVDPDTAATTFTFDLGCALKTRPVPVEPTADPPIEKWTLLAPNNVFIEVRADGHYRQGDSNADPDGAEWKRLPA